MRAIGRLGAFGCALAAMPAAAHAQQIADGAAPDVSIVRVIAAFVLCIAAAVGLALVMRSRLSARSLFPRLAADKRIKAVEIVRLSPHAELALVRHDETEYLLFYGQSGIEILSRGPRPTAAADGPG